MRGGQRHVDVAGLADRLAAVERLDDRQLPRALLDQARDPEQVLAALQRRQSGPPGGGAARGLDRRATSPGPANATSASFSSVAGLFVSTTVPSVGATNLPPMNRSYRGFNGAESRDSGAGA